MASATHLTQKDAAILEALFDPEAGLSGAPQICNVIDPGSHTTTRARAIQTREREILKFVNTDDPSHTDLEHAIESFDELIAQYPEYASGYNNRAQARRMLYSFEELPDHPETVQSIVNDLAKAIDLASPRQNVNVVSPAQAKVLSAAYTHRAYLLYKASKFKSPCSIVGSLEGLAKLDPEALEDMASRDFAAGGRYGNKVAKQLAVKTNPYAKLCGSIVKEAMRKEMEISFESVQC